MEHGLLRHIAEVDMFECHATFQFDQFHASIRLMHMPPRPESGTLFGLGKRTVRISDHTDQGHIALVGLGGLIEQLIDAVGTGRRHRDGIQLARNLRDGARKVLVHGHKGDQGTDAESKVSVQRKDSADCRNQHILQATELRRNRQQDVRNAVRSGARVPKLLVSLFKLRNALRFMGENFDDLLSLHHLLNIAVQTAEFLLLNAEVFAGDICDLAGNKEHERRQNKRNQRERNMQKKHARKDRNYGKRHTGELRKYIDNQLAQCVRVVRIHRHDVAVRMRVKIGYGQRLHMRKQALSDFKECPLSHIDHENRIDVGRNHGNQIDERDMLKRREKRRKIALLGM